jgi:hypothetical protein
MIVTPDGDRPSSVTSMLGSNWMRPPHGMP